MLQPEWDGPDRLWVISDRSGYWNLYRLGADGGEPQPVCPVDADFGGPLWQLGAGWYRVLGDGRLLTVRTLGTDTLAFLDPDTGQLTDLDLGDSHERRRSGRSSTAPALPDDRRRADAGRRPHARSRDGRVGRRPPGR